MLITSTQSGFGAQVEDVSVNALCAPQGRRALRRALVHHRVLVLPQLTIDAAAFGRLARALGSLQHHDFLRGLDQDADVHEIRKEPSHEHNFGGTWHADGSYLRQPPRTVMLQAVRTPPAGGDTVWRCQYDALASLPATLRGIVSQARLRHAAAVVYAEMPAAAPTAVAQEAEHSLVRWVRDAGRAALFHSGPCVQGVVGMGDDEGRTFLDEVFSFSSGALAFRHSWSPGDVVLWDNRATLHMALNDYPGHLRLMRRALVGRETPQAPAVPA